MVQPPLSGGSVLVLLNPCPVQGMTKGPAVIVHVWTDLYLCEYTQIPIQIRPLPQ